jgi:hypothetical protein
MPSISTILHLGQLDFLFEGKDDQAEDEHKKIQVLGLPGPSLIPSKVNRLLQADLESRLTILKYLRTYMFRKTFRSKGGSISHIHENVLHYIVKYLKDV